MSPFIGKPSISTLLWSCSHLTILDLPLSGAKELNSLYQLLVKFITKTGVVLVFPNNNMKIIGYDLEELFNRRSIVDFIPELRYSANKCLVARCYTKRNAESFSKKEHLLPCKEQFYIFCHFSLKQTKIL